MEMISSASDGEEDQVPAWRVCRWNVKSAVLQAQGGNTTWAEAQLLFLAHSEASFPVCCLPLMWIISPLLKSSLPELLRSLSCSWFSSYLSRCPCIVSFPCFSPPCSQTCLGHCLNPSPDSSLCPQDSSILPPTSVIVFVLTAHRSISSALLSPFYSSSCSTFFFMSLFPLPPRIVSFQAGLSPLLPCMSPWEWYQPSCMSQRVTGSPECVFCVPFIPLRAMDSIRSSHHAQGHGALWSCTPWGNPPPWGACLFSCWFVLATLSAQQNTHKPCFWAKFHALLKERPLFDHSSSV